VANAKKLTELLRTQDAEENLAYRATALADGRETAEIRERIDEFVNKR
jgi:hypothetical protein